MLMLLFVIISLFLASPIIAADFPQCIDNRQTLILDSTQNGFGQTVLHKPGWDRYLIYFSSTSSIQNGKIAYPGTQGDPGTYNSTCQTWAADRIWMSWHFGDGLESSGWLSDPGTPRPVLSPGGSGESALIGDPTVIEWKGKIHLFYEGTDNCSATTIIYFMQLPTVFLVHSPKPAKLSVSKDIMKPRVPGLAGPKYLSKMTQLYLTYTDNTFPSSLPKLPTTKRLNLLC
jgi:hypothetical protein